MFGFGGEDSKRPAAGGSPPLAAASSFNLQEAVHAPRTVNRRTQEEVRRLVFQFKEFVQGDPATRARMNYFWPDVEQQDACLAALAHDIPSGEDPLATASDPDPRGGPPRSRKKKFAGSKHGDCVHWLGLVNKINRFAAVQLKLPARDQLNEVAAQTLAPPLNTFTFRFVAPRFSASLLRDKQRISVTMFRRTERSRVLFQTDAVGGLNSFRGGKETYEPWVTYTNRLMVYLFAGIPQYEGPDDFAKLLNVSGADPFPMKCKNPLCVRLSHINYQLRDRRSGHVSPTSERMAASSDEEEEWTDSESDDSS